ncbi:MAG: 3-oxoacyl-[acyl-carrier-protein] synthase III C-terminal domain-containing protein [Lautropia sp.]|nr:3-oxoacyl-[acyl-carrier-protein] synthase III C-terminal domain-containing protein [Lautropia sp.]
MKVAFPGKVVSNDDIIKEIKFHSKNTSPDVLDAVIKKVRFCLDLTGSKHRKWLLDHEKPIDLVCDAATLAMAESGVAVGDIDLLIYVGIGRGFIEPGGAYHVASSLGMNSVACFDIIDACMSWVRGVYLAKLLLDAGIYNRVMIVNAEFNMIPGGPVYPEVFNIKDVDSLEWSFPSFTLGEAASATILKGGNADSSHGDWAFEFSSSPRLADLCNIPIHGFDRYASASPRIAANGCGYFTSFGDKLIEFGEENILEVMSRLKSKADLSDAKALFTHTSSYRDWLRFCRILGLQDIYKSIFSSTGNIVSASIPAALSLSIDEGKVRRGDKIVGWVGSAGMSFSAFSFVY